MATNTGQRSSGKRGQQEDSDAVIQNWLRKRAGEQRTNPIAKRDRSPTAPLSYSQEQLWVLHHLEGATSSYNVPQAFRIVGDLDVEALRWSLNEIVRRHEILRTSFPLKDGAPLQTVHSPFTLDLPLEDLSAHSVDERGTEAIRIATEDSRRPFDLSKAPLLRARLIRLSGTDHLLLLVAHHIVIDGWSLAVINTELALLYEASHRGEVPPTFRKQGAHLSQ